MNTIDVYKFKRYDITTDNNSISGKYASLEVIKEMGATPILEEKITINTSQLDGNNMYDPLND